MTNTKDLILKLRAVYQEKKISYDKILVLMEQDGEFTSKATLSRLFGNNWQKHSFDYERTLIPIANALLDVETYEDEDNADTQAYKSLLKFKMSVIDQNARQIAELKKQLEDVSHKERDKYNEKLGRIAAEYQKTMAFYADQIALKDKRIDMLMEDNHILLTQLLSCPCRKSGTIQGDTT